MNRCGQNNRFSFLSLIHLFDQYFHSGFGYFINLLSDSTGRNDSFIGDWRIVKSNYLIIFWK